MPRTYGQVVQMQRALAKEQEILRIVWSTRQEQPEIVDIGGGWKAFSLFVPQFGGYVTPAVVSFHEHTGSAQGGMPCFDVGFWHDGEFSKDPEKEPPDILHCCNALQFVEFGLTVYEMQAKHSNGNVALDIDGLKILRDRLNDLIFNSMRE